MKAKESGKTPIYNKLVNSGSGGGSQYWVAKYKDGSKTVVRKPKGLPKAAGKVIDISPSGKRTYSNLNPYAKLPKRKKK